MQRSKTAALTLLFAATAAAAQSPAQSSRTNGWDAVRALTPGTSLEIKRIDGRQHCTLRAVDADSLTCTRGRRAAIPRTDILTVAIAHRGRSALLLGAIGAGAGLGMVKLTEAAVFGQCCTGGRKQPEVYAAGAGLGALVFTPIGFFWDFSASTVGKTP